MITRGWRALAIAAAVLAFALPAVHAEPPASAAEAPAAEPAASPPATAGADLMVDTLLRATRQLGLTTTQQTQIDQILANERSERQTSLPAPPDLTVLGNPDSPGYSAAVSNAEAQATQRIESASALVKSIYAVLTAEQRKALPQVLAQMQAQQTPPTRRAAIEPHTAAHSGSGG